MDTALRIGAALKRARTGQGMDIRTAEERTKIRAKYLRALEAEDWRVLPSTAYAKGFLRTYGTLLGLDSEVLVDEYRRQVERHEPETQRLRVGEPVLEHRRRPLDAERRPLPSVTWLGVAGVGVLVVVLLIGVAGGGSDDGKRHRGQAGGGGHATRGAGPGIGASGGPATLRLEALQDVQVCLVRSSGDALIDSQALSSGYTSGVFPADRFRLDLESGGAVQLKLEGRGVIVRSRRAASYEITASGVRPIEFRGPRCP